MSTRPRPILPVRPEPATSSARNAPLLFVHGSLANGRMWAPYIEAFSARQAITVDLPGYGSCPSLESPAPQRLADAVKEVRRQVGIGEEPPDVVAYSFGAAVAIRFALDHPDCIKSLTLVEPTWFNVLLDLGPRGAAAYATIDRVARAFSFACADQDRFFAIAPFVDYWNGRGTFAGLPSFRQDALALKADQVRRDFEAIFNERLGLVAFRTLWKPTLIVTGTASPDASRLVAEAIARVAPRASATAIAGAGHMLPITHAAELIGVVGARLQIETLPQVRAA